MKFSTALSLALAAPIVTAFTTCPSAKVTTRTTSLYDSPFFSSDISKALDKEVSRAELSLFEKKGSVRVND